MTTCAIMILLIPLPNLGSATGIFNDTEKVIIRIGSYTIEKDMSPDVLRSIIDIGVACKKDFLTIYNKDAPLEDVAKAFENIKPFFNALVENEMTDRTAEELTILFQQIREKIREPYTQRSLSRSTTDGPRPLGNWNGMPSPVFINIACGIFNAGVPAIGFTLGTHTILPTVGADVLTTWADTGETISIGFTGFTTSTGPEFGLIAGFIGIMIVLPLMILGFIFQVGFAGAYVGVSPSPI